MWINLDRNFLHTYPEIKWGKIMKMRDIISHHYNEIDEIEVFTACKYDVPQLEKTVVLIIKELNDKITKLKKNKEDKHGNNL